MPKKFLILVSLITLLPLGVMAYLYLQAGRILYYKYGQAYWQTQHPAQCSPYRQQYFENLAPQKAGAIVDLSCAEALQLPAKSAFANNAAGLKIHYKIFAPSNTQAPLLLHVSGLTSDWLNAARYIKAAERMGFQLVSMEMRGHGNSDTDGTGVSYGCKEKDDVLAVVKALSDFKRPIYLWGSSGGTMAIVNAAQALQQSEHVQAIVLENPIPSLIDVAKVKSPGLPEAVYAWAVGMASWRGGVDFQSCAPIQNAEQLQIPTLVTVSEQDQLTPPWMAHKLYKALNEPKSFKAYPQGQHERIWNGQAEQYESDLLRFWQAHQP